MLLMGLRQNSEALVVGCVRIRNTQALARISSSLAAIDHGYAACSSAHTSPQLSWNRRRWSARETVSFRCSR